MGKFNRLMLWLNYFAAIALLLSLLAGFISPATFWPMAFFGISFPLLFLINLFFVIYWGVQMRGWALLSVILLLSGTSHFLCNVQFNFSEKSPANTDVKIMNYNCMLFDLYNWSNNGASRKIIFDMLRDEAPDIVCFQEFYTSEQKGDYNNADTLQKLLRAKNMHAEYSITMRQQDHWGAATFSKYPIIRKGKISFDTESNNLCIYTDVLVNGDTLRVYNLHLASINFGKKEYKFIKGLGKKEIPENLEQPKSIFKRLKKGFLTRAVQADMVAAHMASCPYKMIVCGDLNDTPSSYAYHTLSKNLADAFRESGSGIGKTYNGPLPFLRIDYIMHSKNINSYNYRVLNESLTDHYPVTCYLHLEE